MRAILKKAQALQKKNATSGTDPFYNAVSAGMNSSTRQRLFGSANGSSDCINDKFNFSGSNDGKGGGKMGEHLEYECRSVDSSSNNVYSQNNIGKQTYKSADLLSPSSPTHSLSQTSTVTTSESPTAFDNTKVGYNNNNNIVSTGTKPEQKGGMLLNMLHDTAQNQPVTMLLPKVRKQRKRKANDGNSIKSPIGRSPKRKFSEDDLRDMRTPTPSSTPDHNMSSGSTSPAGPYDTSTFFPIKSSPSMESSSNTNKLTSLLETVVKMEQLEQSPVRRSISVDPCQASEISAKFNENSSPDLFTNQSNKDQYEFTSADGAEPNFSGYRSESNGAEVDTSTSWTAEKLKERKVKKIKLESPSLSEMKMSSVAMDIQCLVAEQVAKLHGDSISPPPPLSVQAATTMSSSSGSTSIKISTKDGVKISTKVGSIKKQGKRSSSAGIDAESRRKSEAKKEKKRKRAESADALEHKTSIKLLPLPSGTRVNQSSEKKSGDIARLMSHGVKPSTPTSGSGGSSQSKLSLTTTIKKSPSYPSGATTSPKSISILKHSQGNKNSAKSTTNRQLTSSKLSPSGLGDGMAKSLSSRSLKFHSSNKMEKHNSEKMKLKQLNIPSATTITAIVSNKLNHPTPSTVAFVQSPLTDPSKSSCFAITTPPSMSITPVTISTSPSSPNESGKNNTPVTSPPIATTWSSTGSNGNDGGNTNKNSPIKTRKNSLSAVIDKLLVHASGIIFPSGEQVKNESMEKKAEKKESNKSVDSRKYNADSKSSDNKAEFTVKQSSQGIKLTVTKTRTTDGSSRVSKNKAGNKSGSWTSSNSSSPSKSMMASKASLLNTLSSVTSAAPQISSKKHFSSSSNSSKIVSKSSSSSLKITGTATSSATKVTPTSSATKGTPSVTKSTAETKTIYMNDLRQKFEERLKVPKLESKERKDKQSESESEKAFQLLLAQSKSSTSYIMNSFISAETKTTFASAGTTESSLSKTVTTQPSEEPKPPILTTYSSMDMPIALTKSADSLSKTDINRSVPPSPKLSESSSVLPKLYDRGMDLSMSAKAPLSLPQNLVKPKKKIPSPPKSDDEDEDELVIDCPGTPRRHKLSFEGNSAASFGSMEQVNKSGSNQEPKAAWMDAKFSPPEPSPGPMKSPINISTPHSEVLSNPSSVSRPSPCIIDDDLMDEALMLGN